MCVGLCVLHMYSQMVYTFIYDFSYSYVKRQDFHVVQLVIINVLDTSSVTVFGYF